MCGEYDSQPAIRGINVLFLDQECYLMIHLSPCHSHLLCHFTLLRCLPRLSELILGKYLQNICREWRVAFQCVFVVMKKTSYTLVVALRALLSWFSILENSISVRSWNLDYTVLENQCFNLEYKDTRALKVKSKCTAITITYYSRKQTSIIICQHSWNYRDVHTLGLLKVKTQAKVNCGSI
jgi:hypothetical protein